MKKIIVIIVSFTAHFIAAQGTVTKDLGDFDKVKVFDKISVTLIKSNKNKIEISGNRSEEVELINKNGDLKIRMPLQKLLKGEEINAKLYLKFIDNIEVSEGSSVSSNDTFKSVSFDVNAKEGAQININLKVDKVNARVNSGGIITLSGQANTQDIVITSGGVFNGKTLKTAQTAVSINAGGSADVNADNLVDAKTRAGGTIVIYGSPKQINKKTILGGTIKEAD